MRQELGSHFINVIFVSLGTFFFAYGQEVEIVNVDSMMNALEQELFPDTTRTIPLYSYLSSNTAKLDTTVSIRTLQPDSESVLINLETLMYTKDPLLYDKLLSLYNRHMKNFEVEWAQAFMNNYYAPEEVKEQYAILCGFEIALKSLKFAKEKLTSDQIWNYYLKEKRLSYQFHYKDPEVQCKLMKEMIDISPRFRALRPCVPYFAGVRFYLVDPYLEELEPFLLDLLDNCKWEDCQSFDCWLLIQVSKYIYQTESKKIASHFVSFFEGMRKCNRHTMSFGYAAMHNDEKLSRFLTDKYLEEFLYESNYPYHKLYMNDFNAEILVNRLQELVMGGHENIGVIISKIPKDGLNPAAQSRIQRLSKLAELHTKRK